uniref:efflux RND transporter permease subunit n=1 Tax=Escherichia coli TaxID=562 RepID=UPI0013D35382
LLIVIILVALTGFLFTKTASELAPEEDGGFLVSLVNAPQYATTDYTLLYANQIAALTKDLPELKARFNIAGLGTTNSAFAIWVFKD